MTKISAPRIPRYRHPIGPTQQYRLARRRNIVVGALWAVFFIAILSASFAIGVLVITPALPYHVQESTKGK